MKESCRDVEIPYRSGAVYLKPAQKFFPSLGKKKQPRDAVMPSSEGITTVVILGVVCQIVSHGWPVKKTQVCLMKTVLVHTMCKVYEVTRTVIQGQELSYLPTKVSKIIISESSKTQDCVYAVLLWM